MSKALALLCQGLIMTGEGLKQIAAELQTAADLPISAIVGKTEETVEEEKPISPEPVSPEPVSPEPPKAKKAVEPAKKPQPEEPPADPEKLRADCTAAVKKICFDGKKDSVLAVFKELKIGKVGECKDERLPLLLEKLNGIGG